MLSRTRTRARPAPCRILAAASILLPAAAAIAQGSIVSPTLSATSAGSSANAFPFNSPVPRRYMQIHGDLGDTPRFLQKLRFRPNAPATATTYHGTLALDVELFLGHAEGVGQASMVFQRNYLAPPVTAIARKTVQMGPLGTLTPLGATTFHPAMELVLDAPFPYSGGKACVWELVVHANTISGSFATVDAESALHANGTSTITGAGCIAQGQAMPMSHTLSAVDSSGILALNFTVAAAPAHASVLGAIGVANPNLRVFGLCSNLYTDLLAVLPIGTASATGAITTTEAGASTLILPNLHGGATLHTQCHAPDPGRVDPLRLCNSNGRATLVPMPNLGKVIQACRIFNNAGGTSATQGEYLPTGAIGYVLPTEFVF